MILTRENYCIPFKEVLELHKGDFDLERIYEILLVHNDTGEIKIRQITRMANRCMALSFARGYFYGTNYTVFDAWCIDKRKNDVVHYTWPNDS